jgi:hypothetical protein
MPQQTQSAENPAKQNELRNGQPHANEMNEPAPHVGQPLDGRHYLDVLEEQEHAECKPQPDGENPRHPDAGSPAKSKVP